jgi:hypothetical protein
MYSKFNSVINESITRGIKRFSHNSIRVKMPGKYTTLVEKGSQEYVVWISKHRESETLSDVKDRFAAFLINGQNITVVII